ncbi:hypothetical protein KKF91_03670 [Myxococcota bacterium]|nr:hypothetical protein [Myxococcota bacterium]MBU1429641.1 hypothetical protein [Myxococcota bacterium]MBU1896229.1 hypothetical protein [Myxococcota bacterium]
MRLLQLLAIATLTVFLSSCTGAECSTAADCDAVNNEICADIDPATGKGECRQDDNGRRCTEDKDCADGEMCMNTYCKNKPGESCIRHSECSSGLCSVGRCTE